MRRGGRHDCLLIRRVDERETAFGVCVVAAPRGPHALVGLGATEPFGAQRVRLVAVHGVLARVRPRRVRVAAGLARGLGAPRLLRGGAGRGARGLLGGGAGRGARGLRGGRGAAPGGGGETARDSGRARGERRGLGEGVHGRGAQKGSFAGARRAVTRREGRVGDDTVSWLLAGRRRKSHVTLTTGFLLRPRPLAAASRAGCCAQRPASADVRVSRPMRVRRGTPRARGSASPPRPFHAGRRDSPATAVSGTTRSEAWRGRSEYVAAGTRGEAPFAPLSRGSTTSGPRRGWT